ncbi:MAG: 1,4-alpha-glucan branching protein 1,4-alpha-glucan branching enzyme [Candidatus Saccharibacteria bacterium]|nr:1,4-alpha-glucan branching protein 1,4-alpha-glucan branching enzyme [Candidatus Saccharibacteria bacterium]
MADATPIDEKLTATDPWLAPYHAKIQRRLAYTAQYAKKILQHTPVSDFAVGHHYFGLHQLDDGWAYRDWLPSATKIYLVGEFSNWQDNEAFALQERDNGEWELTLPADTLHHLDHYKLHVYWNGGDGFRVPAWANYTVQDPDTKSFDAAVWAPGSEFAWHDDGFAPVDGSPLVYEAHVGMSSTEEKVATYREFSRDVIPRIKAAGYNTIQLMAIAEHPYYGSFGYHVSSFFAPSSRFGTPDEFRHLVDTAHAAGLRVVMDIVQSHAVKNENEGISRYDGTLSQFFHAGERGNHAQWDSRVFDYGKPEVAHFLLSNCRYWLDEFHVDGFRFDGITSMLYTHHGLDQSFDNYDKYFDDTDDDALAYLTLANQLIHDVKLSAVTIAEDMSGMPGLAMPIADGGVGFDYRLSMGTPDLWIKYTQDLHDEDWKVSELLHELNQHRAEEKTISYAESHDQALVGDKTLMFRLADKDLYHHMQVDDENLVIDRAVALHKMIRLLTAGLNHGGYLNFMGNEFGHPEWIDFPRADNGWSYKYARRQWNLADDKKLKYHYLGEFDHDMIEQLFVVSDEVDYTLSNDGDYVVSFMRGNLLFAFNFHPEKSFTDYPLPARQGNYEVALSSDDPKYGGFDRIDTSITYPAGVNERVKVYLPARTAIVLKMI